jgi:hypothetical protein
MKHAICEKTHVRLRGGSALARWRFGLDRDDANWMTKTASGGIGAIAYVGETVGHEFLGHGSVCLLDGGHITALAKNQTIPW